MDNHSLPSLPPPPVPPLKQKVSLTVNTGVQNFQEPQNVLCVPKANSNISPQVSSKSVQSSVSLSPLPADGSTKTPTTKKKNVKLSSSKSGLMNGSPLYGEVSGKMNLLFQSAHDSHDSTFNSGSSSSQHRFSTYSYTSNKGPINSQDLGQLNVSPNYHVYSQDDDKEEEEEEDGNVEEGMFDDFAFENMVASRYSPIKPLNNNRIVSDPTNKTSEKSPMNEFGIDEFGVKLEGMSRSLPIGQKPTENRSMEKIPPMTNILSKKLNRSSDVPLPLSLPEINEKLENMDANTQQKSSPVPLRSTQSVKHASSNRSSIHSAKSALSLNISATKPGHSSSSSSGFSHKHSKSIDSNNSGSNVNTLVPKKSSIALNSPANNTLSSARSSASLSTTYVPATNLAATSSSRKVISLVKLGSKSIKYQRDKSSVPFSKRNSSFNPLDDWDGHSGSFEKIGPVGKKPNPPGQTISVTTTSNLHCQDAEKRKSSTSITGLKTPSDIKSQKSPSFPYSPVNEYNFKSDFEDRPSLRPLSQTSLPKSLDTEKINVNKQFLPKTNKSSVKILITANFIDYKFVDITSVSTLSKFMNLVATKLKIKGEPHFYITEIGSSKDKLGKKLDSKVLQTIWDSLQSTPENITLIFYVTQDEKLKDIATPPPKSSTSHHDKVEETSIYTNSSYTNSINSDSSYDRYLPTPQQMILKKDSPADYWSVKDNGIDRKPSLNRAHSITHSSLSAEGTTVISTPSLSSKTSKTSIGFVNQSSLTSNATRSTTKSGTSNTSSTVSVESSANGSFKVIQPQKPHVDFDNKRPSPFNPTRNLVAQRQPPPPPASPTQLPKVHATEKPFSISSTIRSQRKRKPLSNSIKSLQRTNTQGSIFSTKSSSSGVSIDPFAENRITFANFESDGSSVENNSDGTRAEVEKKLRKRPADDEENNKSESENESDSSSGSDDDEFGLFSKKPKSVNSLSNTALNESGKEEGKEEGDHGDKGNVDETSNLCQKAPKTTNKRTLVMQEPPTENPHAGFAKALGNVIEHEASGLHRFLDSSKLKQRAANAGNPTERSASDSSIPESASSSSLTSSLDFRPPPEVLYDNLEVFFPKADLDSLIIDEPPTNGSGIGRMKSIRIVAQEASRRNSVIAPLKKSPASKRLRKAPSNLNNSMKYNTNSGNLLRRTSTKMWGQKVVEVKPDSINKKLVPKRGKNGEFLEFAWIKGEMIGIGKFGKVFVALNVTTGELIAVKQMTINSKFLNRKETNDLVDTFKSEVDSLKDLDHINIVQYLGFEIKDPTYSIFLEYVSGGSIGHLLRKYGRFEETVVKFLTEQALEGLNYIHSKNILHRDLKADNLLLEPDGTLKISDFGISRKSKDIYTSQSKLNFQGTIFWMAPEIIDDNKGVGYNAKVDIWALGCVVIEMFTGERPWSKYEGEGVLYKIGKEKLPPPIKKEIRSEMSLMSKTFLRRCFEVDASRRPTAQMLLEDPFCIVSPDFEFAVTNLGKRIFAVEEQEKGTLNKRMQSMARKL
ncbi:MAP kinase kinase kinase mkh1 [Pichia kudriavzevii]|uniref:MAP kinase kinase kinase mkh1 n=1 Tax=Pichia kudriavzevii TaxID=4909 RepID=A0A1V2LQE1_PICKU|nr:MAP kinase kinase kinase mkh1 [Pichia kudriavzevii]